MITARGKVLDATSLIHIATGKSTYVKALVEAVTNASASTVTARNSAFPPAPRGTEGHLRTQPGGRFSCPRSADSQWWCSDS